MVVEPDELAQIKTLSELSQRVDGCQRCSLAETRTNLVFGVGNPASDIFFVGEAPGFHEDKQGEPFVGAAGKLLDELLLTILGIDRKDIYIGNVLKCRPPNNRDPLPDEIVKCRPYIERQIELINPLVICTLGSFSTRLLLKSNVYISKAHGTPVTVDGRLIFPTYHPAAALYARTTKEILAEDFKKLGDLLMNITREVNSKPEAEDENKEQMELF